MNLCTMCQRVGVASRFLLHPLPVLCIFYQNLKWGIHCISTLDKYFKVCGRFDTIMEFSHSCFTDLDRKIVVWELICFRLVLWTSGQFNNLILSEKKYCFTIILYYRVLFPSIIYLARILSEDTLTF